MLNQGGLFIVNADNPHDKYLELVAAYAYDRKKYIQKRVDIGQGILGQAYLEKENVYLRVIPKDYVHITSGLGTAPPSRLLIVPLKINGEIHALVELASFHDIEEHQIQFIETFGENIAVPFSKCKDQCHYSKFISHFTATSGRDEITRRRNATKYGRAQRHARGDGKKRKRIFTKDC